MTSILPERGQGEPALARAAAADHDLVLADPGRDVAEDAVDEPAPGQHPAGGGNGRAQLRAVLRHRRIGVCPTWGVVNVGCAHRAAIPPSERMISPLTPRARGEAR